MAVHVGWGVWDGAFLAQSEAKVAPYGGIRWEQPDDGFESEGLARARFSGDSQRLAAVEM